MPSPLPRSKQLEDKIVHCVLCLKREQQVFAKRKGFGQMSNVKSYSVTMPTCILNRHLKEQHNIIKSEGIRESAGSSNKKQAQITKYAEGVSELRRASSLYDLNRDFTVWSVLLI